jgi:N-acyl homoserine lactone hydrolase
MAISIEILNTGDVTVDSSFLVKYRSPGRSVSVCSNVFLLHGLAAGPVLVDTGFRSKEVMATGGLIATESKEGTLEDQLEARGIKHADVAVIIHTHLHMDHAGKDDLFPDSTQVVVARRELEVGCGGSGGHGYPLPDMKHLLGRVWRPNAIRLLDTEDGDIIEIMPGVAVEHAGGHSEGSLNILAETNDGIARICGDVFYNLDVQLRQPFEEVLIGEQHTSGNTSMSERSDRRAMKRAVRGCKWLLPSHDAPGRLEAGKLVGRVSGTVVPEVHG